MNPADEDRSGPNPIADAEALRRDLLTERYRIGTARATEERQPPAGTAAAGERR